MGLVALTRKEEKYTEYCGRLAMCGPQHLHESMGHGDALAGKVYKFYALDQQKWLHVILIDLIGL